MTGRKEDKEVKKGSLSSFFIQIEGRGSIETKKERVNQSDDYGKCLFSLLCGFHYSTD